MRVSLFSLLIRNSRSPLREWEYIFILFYFITLKQFFRNYVFWLYILYANNSSRHNLKIIDLFISRSIFLIISEQTFDFILFHVNSQTYFESAVLLLCLFLLIFYKKIKLILNCLSVNPRYVLLIWQPLRFTMFGDSGCDV